MWPFSKKHRCPEPTDLVCHSLRKPGEKDLEHKQALWLQYRDEESMRKGSNPHAIYYKECNGNWIEYILY